jgi:hypothetical protein
VGLGLCGGGGGVVVGLIYNINFVSLTANYFDY